MSASLLLEESQFVGLHNRIRAPDHLCSQTNSCCWLCAVRIRRKKENRVFREIGLYHWGFVFWCEVFLNENGVGFASKDQVSVDRVVERSNVYGFQLGKVAVSWAQMRRLEKETGCIPAWHKLTKKHRITVETRRQNLKTSFAFPFFFCPASWGPIPPPQTLPLPQRTGSHADVF